MFTEGIEIGPLTMPLWAVCTVTLFFFLTFPPVLGTLLRAGRWLRQRPADLAGREKKFTEFDPEGLRFMEPQVGVLYRLRHPKRTDYYRVTHLQDDRVTYDLWNDTREPQKGVGVVCMTETLKQWRLGMVGAEVLEKKTAVVVTEEQCEGVDIDALRTEYQLAVDAATQEFDDSFGVGERHGIWNAGKNAVRNPLKSPKVGDVFGEKYTQTFGEDAGKETEFEYHVHAVLDDWIIVSFGDVLGDSRMDVGRAHRRASWFKAVKEDKMYVKKKAD